MLLKPVLNFDYSETFYPDAVDLETIEKRDCRYTMGRLPTGDDVVKRITYFGGCSTSCMAISIALARFRKQHESPFGCD